MAEKLGSRVYSEAKTQIEAVAYSAKTNRGYRPQPMNTGYGYDPSYDVGQELISNRDYELYGKLAVYGNGNVSYAVNSIVQNSPVFGSSDKHITEEEKAKVRSIFEEKKSKQKKAAEDKDAFIGTVDRLMSEAKLDISAASSMNEIKEVVNKFKSDIDKLNSKE